MICRPPNGPLQAQIDQVESDIEEFDLWPVISFGIAIRIGSGGRSGESTPIKIRLRAGGTVEGFGPVQRDSGLVQFRLATGQLVSLSARVVEEIVSAENKPVASSRTERAPSAPAQTAPLRSSNADLPPPILTGPARKVDAADPPSADPDPSDQPAAETTEQTDSATAIPSYDTYRDRNGNGEQYWRDRKAGLDYELAAVREEIVNLRNALLGKSLRLSVKGAGTTTRHTMTSSGTTLTRMDDAERARRDAEWEAAPPQVMLRGEAIKLLQAAEKSEVELQAALDGLGQEAHSAGALPDWLR